MSAAGRAGQRISFEEGFLFDAGLVSEWPIHRLYKQAQGRFRESVLAADGRGDTRRDSTMVISNNEGPMVDERAVIMFSAIGGTAG